MDLQKRCFALLKKNKHLHNKYELLSCFYSKLIYPFYRSFFIPSQYLCVNITFTIMIRSNFFFQKLKYLTRTKNEVWKIFCNMGNVMWLGDNQLLFTDHLHFYFYSNLQEILLLVNTQLFLFFWKLVVFN